MTGKKAAIVAFATAATLLSIGSAEAAQGCGSQGWRDAWGVCHYAGPVVIQSAPVVYAAPAPVYSPYACPPGSWLGPWGHCRSTPYHGRLPNGGWQ